MSDSAFSMAYVIVATAVGALWVRQLRIEYHKLVAVRGLGAAWEWLRRARLASLLARALIYPYALSASGALVLSGRILALRILVVGGLVLATVSILGGVCHGIQDHKCGGRE
jgi:hypothetical protein